MASWKKVVLRGDNLTTEQLTATDVAFVPADDDLAFFDDGDGYIRKRSFATVAGQIAGAALGASSGVINLSTTGLDAHNGDTSDVILVYNDDSSAWQTKSVSAVGQAGSNTQYTTVTSTSGSDVVLTLTASDASDDDTITFTASNGLTVTQDNGDDIDLSITTTPTDFTSIFNTGLQIGYAEAGANIDFSTDNQIDFEIDGESQVQIKSQIFQPTADNDVDLGSASYSFKDAHIQGTATIGTVSATDMSVTNTITGSVNGNAGSASTVSTATDSGDATHYVAFVDSTSGDQQIKTDAGITYNPHSNVLSTSASINANITGSSASCTGNASTASTATEVTLTGVNASQNYNIVLTATDSDGAGALLYDNQANGLKWNPSTDTLSVNNLNVTGTTTTVQTTNLEVEDKNITLAEGSADTATASGAGLTIGIASSSAADTAQSGEGEISENSGDQSDLPQLLWNHNTALSGWTVSNFFQDEVDADGNAIADGDTAALDVPIAVMKHGTANPADDDVIVTQMGVGSLFYNDGSGSGTAGLWIYTD